jgi:hypothetical protein
MTKRSQWWLIGTLLVVALLVALALGVRKPAEQTSQAPTSYSPLAYGTKAFFMTMERLGYRPRRWRFEWTRLEHEKGVLLYAPSDPITAGGQFRPMGISAARAAERWLERGNTLLYFLNQTEREKGQSMLLEALDVSLQFEPLPPDHQTTQNWRQFLPTRLERDYDTILPVPWAAGVMRVTGEAVPGFSASKGNPVVLSENREFAHVCLIPYGKGRLYLFSSSAMMDNHFLARSSNLNLLLDILDRERTKDGAILFDEFHHGFSSEFGAASFTQLPVVRFAALQGLILVSLFVATSWRRFGRPIPLVRDTRRSIREYTQSLGNLYFRARTHREALEFLFQELRRSLSARYNLPESADDSVIEDELRVQRGAAEAWRELAYDCGRLLKHRRIANSDLLAASRKMEEFRKLIA